jgi:hypothetical protein
MVDHLNPDPTAPRRLLAEIRDFLTALAYVDQILVFGSLATGTEDCWSDIDLIVVTENRTQFRDLFERLRQHKTIRYHSPFTLTDDPVGGLVLGNVFVDEAIFHVLDLNFLTRADRQLPGVLDRFGPIREIYQCDIRPSDSLESAAGTTISDPLDPEEEQFYFAIHFTKKALKQILRGGGDSEKLRHNVGRLETVLHDNLPGFTTPNGDIGCVAQCYHELAYRVLNRHDNSIHRE